MISGTDREFYSRNFDLRVNKGQIYTMLSHAQDLAAQIHDWEFIELWVDTIEMGVFSIGYFGNTQGLGSHNRKAIATKTVGAIATFFRVLTNN